MHGFLLVDLASVQTGPEGLPESRLTQNPQPPRFPGRFRTRQSEEVELALRIRDLTNVKIIEPDADPQILFIRADRFLCNCPIVVLDSKNLEYFLIMPNAAT